MNHESRCDSCLSHALPILFAGLCQTGCAIHVGSETPDTAPITRIESSTPVRQWPVKDPYIVNNGGKIQVIPDERYEPRPSKK